MLGKDFQTKLVLSGGEVAKKSNALLYIEKINEKLDPRFDPSQGKLFKDKN